MLAGLRARPGGPVKRHPLVQAALTLALAPLLSAVAPAPAAAAGPDWNAVAAVERVEILTSDEDGETRETTVWLAVVDGQGYVRTGNTTWGENVLRNPEVKLRIEAAEYALRAELVEDEALRARIQQTFRDKYGFSDSMVAVFHMGGGKHFRLVPR
jgi:hypothetical protein